MRVVAIRVAAQPEVHDRYDYKYARRAINFVVSSAEPLVTEALEFIAGSNNKALAAQATVALKHREILAAQGKLGKATVAVKEIKEDDQDKEMDNEDDSDDGDDEGENDKGSTK